MAVIKSFPSKLAKNQQIALAVGFFDGVHLGHQAILEQTIKVAKERGLIPCALTLSQSPKAFLSGGKEQLLTTLADKKELMAGIAVLFVLDFNQQTAAWSASQFEQLLMESNVAVVVGGPDYHYGTKGSGSINDLEQATNGVIKTEIVDFCLINQQKIASRTIHEFVTSGQMEAASTWLGRPHTVKGMVVDGKKKGRQYGYPTMNVLVDERYLLPPDGVYGVKMGEHQGMAYVKQRMVEVHLFDFNCNMYDQQVAIGFFFFLRQGKKMGEEALIKQLQLDEKAVKDYFKSSSAQ